MVGFASPAVDDTFHLVSDVAFGQSDPTFRFIIADFSFGTINKPV